VDWGKSGIDDEQEEKAEDECDGIHHIFLFHLDLLFIDEPFFQSYQENFGIFVC
jgi:hypothetical protein